MSEDVDLDRSEPVLVRRVQTLASRDSSIRDEEIHRTELVLREVDQRSQMRLRGTIAGESGNFGAPHG